MPLDSLDIEDPNALLEYLMSRGIAGVNRATTVQKLEGGVSNRVMLVHPKPGQPFVIKQALPKLRVQVDWFCTPARIEREALGLRYLAQLASTGSVPALLFEDRENFLLAMEAVPQPHENWKAMLLAGRVSPRHVFLFGHLLGSIHANSARRALEISRLFGDRSIYETLRIEPYYWYTMSRIPAAAQFLAGLVAETLNTQLTLVHGDYSPKNILIHKDHPVLLDCEVVHFGDPGFDIGFSMAHLLSKAHHLAAHRQVFTDAAQQYWSAYWNCVKTEPWTKDLESRAVRHSLACTLARVAGRSPLEYLNPEERSRQQRIVLDLINDPPQEIPNLISDFVGRLACP